MLLPLLRLRKEGWFLGPPGDLAGPRCTQRVRRGGWRREREKTGALGLASGEKGSTWKGQGGYFLVLNVSDFS